MPAITSICLIVAVLFNRIRAHCKTFSPPLKSYVEIGTDKYLTITTAQFTIEEIPEGDSESQLLINEAVRLFSKFVDMFKAGVDSLETPGLSLDIQASSRDEEIQKILDEIKLLKEEDYKELYCYCVAMLSFSGKFTSLVIRYDSSEVNVTTESENSLIAQKIVEEANRLYHNLGACLYLEN